MSIETIKIKDYINSTNKLKITRGASYLLDYLNQVVVKEHLIKQVGEENIIYVGAGNAKFFVQDESKAKEIKAWAENLYKTYAHGSKIAVSYVKQDGKLWEDMDRLAKETNITKSKGFNILNIDLPEVEKCELCGTNPATISSKNLEKDIENLRNLGIIENNLDLHELRGQITNLAKKRGLICEECFRKLNTTPLYDITFENFKDTGAKINEKNGLEEYSAKNSYIGFMYSDGDGLGEFLKNVKNKYLNKKNGEKEYRKFQTNFSKTLDKNTKEALHEAMKNIFSKVPEKDRIAELLIVGGDDVAAIFRPQLAIEISMEFQRIFEEKMYKYTKKEIGDDIRITSSSGVIIAKAKTPIHNLFTQALKLQKSAKAKRHDEKQKTGYIDWQVIGSEGNVDIQDFRKGINPKENLVMKRPYKVKDMYPLIKTIEAFKKVDFPKTKLRHLYELKVNSKLEEFEKKMMFINTLSKMQNKHIDLIKNNYQVDYENYTDFNENFKNIFDILEIYDFVGGVALNEN